MRLRFAALLVHKLLYLKSLANVEAWRARCAAEKHANNK